MKHLTYIRESDKQKLTIVAENAVDYTAQGFELIEDREATSQEIEDFSILNQTE